MYNELEIIDGYSDQENETTKNIIRPKTVLDEILPNDSKISIKDNEPIHNTIIPKDFEDKLLSDDCKVSILDHNKNHINLSQQDINLNKKMVENQPKLTSDSDLIILTKKTNNSDHTSVNDFFLMSSNTKILKYSLKIGHYIKH